MRVLFVILILALAGLLWASFAAARHIRTVRRRRRLARAAKTAAAIDHRQTLSATAQPSPTGEALRPVRRAPPPPPVFNDADWDDIADLDPLSEVVHTFTPVRRTPISAQQRSVGSQDRPNHEAHANPVFREGDSSPDTGPNVERFNQPVESMHPQALRTRWTHSLHVHG